MGKERGFDTDHPSPSEAISVGLLAVEFAKYAKKKYRHENGDQKSEWFIIKNMLTEIRSTYGDLEVNEFGPGRFESYRQSLVAKGLAKHTIKRYSDYVKKMFQYDVKMEMIPVELNQSLLTCVGKRKRLKSRNAR